MFEKGFVVVKIQNGSRVEVDSWYKDLEEAQMVADELTDEAPKGTWYGFEPAK